MAKTQTGKRIEFVVQMYWRGKRKTPSLGFWVGDDEVSRDFGLPEDCPEWAVFEKAARDLCRTLVEAGELD